MNTRYLAFEEEVKKYCLFPLKWYNSYQVSILSGEEIIEMKTILFIEDDKDLNAGLTYGMKGEGYNVLSVHTITEGMGRLGQEQVDLILLDGNLPDGDGFSLCRKVKQSSDVPVIFLTARDLEEDELMGFDCGADDYITKPFRLPVLYKRIEAALRKHTGSELESVYDDGFLKIDFADMTACVNKEFLLLTPTEYKLLKLLILNKEQVMTKRLLLEKLWDSEGNYVDEHAVAVNINRLRKKIETDSRTYIKTLYGMGYQWKGSGTP